MKKVCTLLGILLWCTLCIAQTITPGGVNLCQGSNATLTAPTGSSYQWFRNGLRVQGAVAKTLVVSQPGEYTVEVNIGGTLTQTPAVTVTVNPVPVANFTFLGNNQCASIPIAFTNTSQGASAYLWNFADSPSGADSISTEENATHRFVGNKLVTTQTFAVKLTASNSAGCKSTITKNVTVVRPNLKLQEGGATVFNGENYFTRCNPQETEFQFTYNAPPGQVGLYNIIWGDGTPDFSGTVLNTLSHNFSQGINSLKFIVSANGCTDTAVYKIFVGSNPGGSISNPSSTQGCTGDVFSFPFATVDKNTEGTLYRVWVNDGTSPEVFTHPPPPFYTHAFTTNSCTGGVNNQLKINYSISNPCGIADGNIGGIIISQKPVANFTFSPKDTGCVNTAINITNTSPALYNVGPDGKCALGKQIWKITPSTGFTITSGSLGNDGFNSVTNWISGSDQLKINFTQPGTYTVKLKMAGSLCGQDSIEKVICINPVPTASFDVDNTAGCAPLDVQVNTTTNDPFCSSYQYQWVINYTPTPGCLPAVGGYQFLNGTSVTSRQPSIRFTNPGTYTLRLTVFAPGMACSTVVAQKQVVVRGKPVIAGLGVPATLCEGAAVQPNPQVDCNIATGTTYQWTFDGAQPASAAARQPGNITFGQPGQWPVSLTATNGCGETTVSQMITVNPVPVLQLPADTAICATNTAGPFGFTSPLGGVAYTWTNSNSSIGLAASGSGNIGAFTASNNSNSNVSSTIRVTGTKSGCSATGQFTLLVRPRPTAPSVTTPLAYCAYEVVPPFAPAYTPGNHVTWYEVPVGGVGDTATPATVPGVPGLYNWFISQTDGFGCESPRTTLTVNIKPAPAIGSITVNAPTACNTNTGSITLRGLTASTTYTVRYRKNGGALQTITQPANSQGNITINNLGAGTYSGLLVLLNGCASAEAAPVSITDPSAPAPPNAAGPAQVCAGAAIQLTAAAGSSGTATYQWSGPGGFSSTVQNPQLTATAASGGTYFVTNTIANCTSAPAAVAVQVNATPAMPTLSGNGSICSGDSVSVIAATNLANVDWLWTGPGGFSGTGNHLAIGNAAPQHAGAYQVRAVAANTGCPSPQANITIAVKVRPTVLGATVNGPTACGASNGSIVLQGLAANTSYQVQYLRNNTPVTSTITSNAQGNVSIASLAAAVYSNVTVQAGGCTSAAAGPFVLTEPNQPEPPQVTAPDSVCTGQNVRFTAVAGSAGTATFRWTGPGLSTTGASPNFTASLASAGEYLVTNTINNCTSLPSRFVLVVSPTPATPQIAGASVLCSGDSLVLTVTNTDTNVDYLWTAPNSITAAGAVFAMPAAMPVMSGNYVVEATLRHTSCVSPTASVPVEIRARPVISGIVVRQPTACGASNGWLRLEGLTPGTAYQVMYQRNGAAMSLLRTAGTAGEIVLQNLASALYTNIRVAANGCTSAAMGPYQLSDPNAPATPQAFANGALCNGDTLRLQVANMPVQPFTTRWMGPNGFTSTLVAPEIPGVGTAAAGKYYVTITKDNCTSPVDSVEVSVTNRPVISSVTATSPLCQGDTLVLTAGSADTRPLEYTWQGPNGFTATGQQVKIANIQPGATGSYQVTARVANTACPSAAYATQVVVAPQPVIAGVTVTQPLSCGAFNGALTLDGLQPTTLYAVQYLRNNTPVMASGFTNGSGRLVIGGLNAGTYTNLVVAAGGCASAPAGPFALRDPNAPAAPRVAYNGPLCSGDTLRLSATTPLPQPYTVQWTGPFGFTSTQLNPQVLSVGTAAAGKYYVTITKDNCTSPVDSVEVSVTNRPVISSVSATSPLCQGDTLVLTAGSADTRPLEYTWQGPNGFTATGQQVKIANIQPGATGSYQVTARVANTACPSAAYATQVVVAPQPVIAGVTVTQPLSCGAFNGSLTLDGLQPTTLYAVQYLRNNTPVMASGFTNGSGRLVIGGLNAGTYTNLVVAAGGCASAPAGPFALRDPNAPAAPRVAYNGPLCSGDTLRLSATTSLTQPFTVQWTGPFGFTSTQLNPQVLSVGTAAAGKYYVTITKDNCTSPVDSVEVSVTNRPVISSVSATSPLCQGDTLVLTAGSADTRPLEYTWQGPNGFTATGQQVKIANIQPGATGSYQVTARVANTACPSAAYATQVVVAPQPVIAGVTVTQPLSCGAFNGALTLDGLQPTTLYAVQYLRNNTPVMASGFTNGSGRLVIGGLNAGTYTNLVVAAGGCASAPAGPFALRDPNAPAAPRVAYNGPLCSGDTLRLSATTSLTQPFTVQWTGPFGFTSTQLNPQVLSVGTAAAGKYYVTLTKDNCTSPVDSVEVSVTNRPVISSVSATSPLCQGDTLVLTAGSADTRPLEYTWQGPNGFTATGQQVKIANIQPGATGSYQVTARVANTACPSAAYATQVVVAPQPAIAGVTVTQPLSCGAFNGALTLDGLQPTTLYAVQYLRNNTPVMASGFTNGSGRLVISGLNAGTYTNLVVAAGGCASAPAGPFALRDPNAPAAPRVAYNGPLCSGDTLRLSATTSLTQPYTVQWTGPFGFTSTQLNPQVLSVGTAAAGKYYVTLTKDNCTSPVDSVEVIIHHKPFITSVLATTALCVGDVLQLSAEPEDSLPVIYTWTGPNGFTANGRQVSIPQVTQAMQGAYQVTALYQGCASGTAVSPPVSVYKKPAIDSITATNPTSCGVATGSLLVHGLQPSATYQVAYTYNSGNVSVIAAFSNPLGKLLIGNLPAGIYSNVSVAKDGCPSPPLGPYTLTEAGPLKPVAGSNGQVCTGGDIRLTASVSGGGNIDFYWTGPAGFSSRLQNPVIANATILHSGTYTVTAVQNGCSASSQVVVSVASLSVGGQALPDTAVCSGGSGVVRLSGFGGTVLRWQSSTNGGTSWNNVAHTGSTLPFQNISVSTLYRAVVQQGGCAPAFSDVSRISIVPQADAADAGADQVVCGSNFASLAANQPTNGTGTWTQTFGLPVTIVNPASPGTLVNGLQPGNTYRFTWTITTMGNCSQRADEVQIVTRQGVAAANAGPDIAVCDFVNSTTFRLGAVVAAGQTVEKGSWSVVQQPAQGSISIAEPSAATSQAVIHQAGRYTLVWTVTNDIGAACGATTDTMQVLVQPQPNAAFTVNAGIQCSGREITVQNQSQNASQYQWWWGDGATTAAVAGTHRYAATGTYQVMLVARSPLLNAMCTDTARHTIVVQDKIAAKIEVAPGNTCMPYQLQVQAKDAVGATRIEWRIFDRTLPGGSLLAQGVQATHLYPLPGNDSVRLTVYSAQGCADSVTHYFTVYNRPAARIQQGNISTCSHDTLLAYTSQVTYGGTDALYYRWYVNNALAGNSRNLNYLLRTPVTASQTVPYDVRLVVQNAGGCGDTTATVRVNVLPLPVAAIRVSPSVIQQQPNYTFTFEDTSGGSALKQHLWFTGDRNQQTRNGKLVTHTYSDTGTFRVRLQTTDFGNGCMLADTVYVTVQHVPGYLQVPNAICPGCTNNDLRRFLPLGKGLSYYRLRVMTSWGKVIFETSKLNADGSPAEAWDATLNNEPVSQNAYRWEIEARYINGTEWKGMVYPGSNTPVKSGFITVVK